MHAHGVVLLYHPPRGHCPEDPGRPSWGPGEGSVRPCQEGPKPCMNGTVARGHPKGTSKGGPGEGPRWTSWEGPRWTSWRVVALPTVQEEGPGRVVVQGVRCDGTVRVVGSTYVVPCARAAGWLWPSGGWSWRTPGRPVWHPWGGVRQTLSGGSKHPMNGRVIRLPPQRGSKGGPGEGPKGWFGRVPDGHPGGW